MKTTKQRLLNIVITLSVGINLVLLGGVGYIAAIDNHIDHLFSAMNTPVVIYLPKSVEGSGDETSTKPTGTQQ